MQYSDAMDKLKKAGQEHLLHFFNELSSEQKKSLLHQIEKIDLATFKKQQELILQVKKPLKKFNTLTKVINYKDVNDEAEAKKLLSEGLYGCLLVAGGQGSRLQFDGPKGLFLVSPVKKKSLFQIFAEKVKAASKLVNRALPFAIMTSEDKMEEIKFFFEQNNYFGLQKSQISFFSQKNLPLLDKTSHLFLENKHTVATGPDGNGSSLNEFFDSGIFDEWQKKGVQFVSYVLIDNPLADPFDLKLLSLQFKEKSDVVIKCIKRKSPEEAVGILVERDDFVNVVEYSEIGNDERFEKDKKGNLKHAFANISLFSFSMEFIKKMATSHELPLHLAFKAVSCLNKEGQKEKSKVPNAFKFEKFIFDVLPFAKNVKIIEYPRNSCFSPLKNLQGDQSIQTVQKDMQELDYQTITKITDKKSPILEPFEIAQDFYYPNDALILKWKGKEIPNEHYIEA